MPGSVLDALCRGFGHDLTRNFAAATGNPAQPEDQLKAPTKALLESGGQALGFDVVTRTESNPPDFKIRPDIGVTVNHLLTGHVELKAPGKGARPARYTGHDKQQWGKFRNHPNLIYTDGNEWALYREGQLIGRVLRVAGDVTVAGDAAFSSGNAIALETLLRDFLGWKPIVPSNPKSLAKMLAPLCRLLREEAMQALRLKDAALSVLANEWRQFLFPDADDFQFADAYAQTVTYALLLAQFEGETDLHGRAAERLDRRHGLLAQVLRILEDPAARREVEVPIELLERSISAVDMATLHQGLGSNDPWLYFYEDFLAAYDPKLRKNRGVYYTPAEVVQCQVTLVAELLSKRFGKSLTFADDDVVVLDPAVGTGTYLLAAIQHGLSTVREEFGEGAVQSRATAAAANFHGFELLIGPYSVAHLRFAQQVLEAGGQLPADGVHVYLTDTLDNPFEVPPGQQQLPLVYRKLTEEYERARKVKSDTRVLVCLGNPPYFREVIDPEEVGRERQGGWVRYGDHGDDGILNDFLKGVPGVHAKNLYNLYVYFWRWALWKVFDSTNGDGVVSFITAASYLRGPGFVGMRRKMRETFDELWVLDLEGDNLGPRKTENVFDIQTAVAIAIGVRSEEPDPDTPAKVHYARITGTEDEKKATLNAIESFSDLDWQECFDGWGEPFLPVQAGDYFDWPKVTDIFPWQHTGVEMKRTWVIAPAKDVLVARWRALLALSGVAKRRAFKETRDRKVDRSYLPVDDRSAERLPSLDGLGNGAPILAPVRYGYRSLDRQYVLPDGRLGDFMRPSLWAANGPSQVYMTSLLTGVLGLGPAATVTADVPDRHHFRGSYSGKDVVPLWRDPDGSQPNTTDGLRELLSGLFGQVLNAEDLFAYAVGVLSATDYVERFSEELTIPGPRLPITKDAALFKAVCETGRRCIWLQTFGERMVPAGTHPGVAPAGRARCLRAVPGSSDEYPKTFAYDEESQQLHVGGGIFALVSREVWEFSVSGMPILASWLDHRVKPGTGRRSSSLDDIRPTLWPAAFTEELLRVIWVLEHMTQLMPIANAQLAAVCAGQILRADELPMPTDEERRPPQSEADEPLTLDLGLGGPPSSS